MTPKDWRHPKFLYAVEAKVDGEWRQLEHITPFREVAVRLCAAAFDHRRSRLVTYKRDKVQTKRKSHGWYVKLRTRKGGK